MTQALAPAGVSHYYRRLAELSTLPFWQLPDITEPSRPKRGHVRHWPDIYPELARSRDIADDAAVLQRRALILCNPGLTRRRPVPPPRSRRPTRCCSPARAPPSTPIPCGSAWLAAEPA